jgi:tetratricopeptide (TPR) repeat protein
MRIFDPAITSAHAKGPKGIGGFLLFFCLILTVISPVIWIVLEIPVFKSRQFDQADLIGAIHQLYGICTGIWIWSGRRSGKKAALAFLLVTVITAFVYAIVSASPVNGPGSYSPVIFSILWWRYFQKSERVKNTYTKTDSPSSQLEVAQSIAIRRRWLRPKRAAVLAWVGVVVVTIGSVFCAFLIRKSQEAKAEERVRAGEIYLRSDQTKKAISAYKEALRFDHRNSDIWCRLAMAYESSKDLPEAIKAYEKAADIAPNEARIQESLGTVLDRAGMPGDAQAAYSKALFLYNADITLHPTYGFLYKSIGDIEQRLGDPARAAVAYASASEYYSTKDDPNDWFEWDFLGDAWLKLGRANDAVAAYERGVKAKPDSESMQTKLRKLRYSHGRQPQ